MSDTRFCECDDMRKPDTEVVGGLLTHKPCGGIVECEFCYLDEDDTPPHAATDWEMDYHICEKHRGAAIDNISTRDWY